MLTIYNSLTRRKETFQPLEPGRVRMYVCGMTVYDHLHIGHARMLLVFDMVVRYLRYRGFDVTFVRNITDVDDKIIQRANESGEEPAALAERFVDAMHEDTDALNMLRPDIEPRATGTMAEMIRMIETLIDKGYAYAVEGGDVYFDVSRFEGYGRLSGERPDEMRAGARVEVDEAKTDPLDFVLWKRAKEGEPSWDSPWGRGRPGWHIECSAMSTRELGNHFDIHGGGLDLKFPHHENEIAQSCAATGEPFVNYWMHNGFVQVDDEKMSKSLGNFFTLRDILASYRPEEVRYFLLASHYRSPINFSDKNLDDARAALERLYLALRDLPDGEVPGDEPYSERFREVMDDDFNTPGAIAVLFDLVRELNRHRDADPGRAADLGALLKQLGGVLGLLQAEPDAFLKGNVTSPAEGERADDALSAEEVEALIEKRTRARGDRDFGEADRIRDYLLENGIQLEDSPQGTRWRRG